MQLSLLVVRGLSQEQVIAVRRLEFCIGRDSTCDLSVNSMLVSRRHAVLINGNGKILVRDLGSRNGTFVNGKAVTDECELHHEDRLRLGPLEYRVQLEPPAAPANSDLSEATLPEDSLSSVADAEEKTDRHRSLPPAQTQTQAGPNGWQVMAALASLNR